ncbi:MAG: hypothetical protein ABSG99_07320 [Sedimentisphaerales bacterium]
MESKWLEDALFVGMTANAFKLGTVLSLGWFWPRVAGCSTLYRGNSMETIDFDNILAVGALDAEQIQTPGYLSHANSTTYFYVIRRANNCGDLEHTLVAAVRVSIDSDGDLAQPRPNSIFEAKAEQLAGSKVRLLWYYCPLDQNSEPECFNIYYDNGTGQIDYENPIATISYAGGKFYSYQSDSLEGNRYLFAIRVKEANGIEDGSLAKLAIQITISSPDPIDILSAKTI